MHPLLLFGFALLSCVAYVRGVCCYPTRIQYSLPEGVTKCGEEIKDGEHKDKDGVVGNIAYKLDRRGLKCLIEVCDDGLWHDGTYCGVGSCNMFGCNCDGGCFGRDGDDALENFKRLNRHHVNVSRIEPRSAIFLP